FINEEIKKSPKHAHFVIDSPRCNGTIGMLFTFFAAPRSFVLVNVGAADRLGEALSAKNPFHVVEYNFVTLERARLVWRMDADMCQEHGPGVSDCCRRYSGLFGTGNLLAASNHLPKELVALSALGFSCFARSLPGEFPAPFLTIPPLHKIVSRPFVPNVA